MKKVDRNGNKISENDRLLKAKKRYNRNIALGTAVGIAGTIGAGALGSYISKNIVVDEGVGDYGL